MVRTQVYLTEAQHLALRRAARREGTSMTALLRRMVEQQLVDETIRAERAKRAVMAIANLGSDRRSDVSENHDEALAEALRGEDVC